MNNSLLEQIRAFRKNVICELDRLEDALLEIAKTQAAQPVQIPPSDDDWLTVKEVCEKLKISQSTFYERIKEGVLPQGLQISPRARRWRMSEILASGNFQPANNSGKKRRKRGSGTIELEFPFLQKTKR